MPLVRMLVRAEELVVVVLIVERVRLPIPANGAVTPRLNVVDGYPANG